MDKEFGKSVRFFKKVIIRRKILEGTIGKFLLDFGKRRFIPDTVTKFGSVLEDSSSSRKKYWLEESYVPLHLLKAFEDKRIARKITKTSAIKHQESGKVFEKFSKKAGFAYLFSKAERPEHHQCGLCKKDVLIRYYRSHYISVYLSLSSNALNHISTNWKCIIIAAAAAATNNTIYCTWF